MKNSRIALGALLAGSLALASGCSTILGIGSVPDEGALSGGGDSSTPDAGLDATLAGSGGAAPSVTGSSGASGSGGSGGSGGSATPSSGGSGGSAPPSCDLGQCQALLAGAGVVPSACAVAACDAATQACVFRARDADGDGHAAAVCSAVGLTIATGDDCDDSNPAVYPTKSESCAEDATGQSVMFPNGTPSGQCALGTKLCKADGTFAACAGVKAPLPVDCTSTSDNNCDSKADDTECGVCVAGAKQTCYDGSASSQGKGRCHTGTSTCVLSGGKTTWGPCAGEVLPAAADTCDSGNDDNCNGSVNEGCQCLNGQTGSCGSELGSLGSCAGGTTTCSGGQWGACSVSPAGGDTCDSGNDANCNGSANDGCPCLNGQTKSCGTSGTGCTLGTQTCSGGNWGGCFGNTCVNFTANSGVDNACGPDCFNGTSCYWSNNVCPTNSHVITCSVTNTGGKGDCLYDGPSGTTASWHSDVSGCDGTHCVLNWCTCRHDGF